MQACPPQIRSFTRSTLRAGLFRYDAEATLHRHEHLVLRVPDGEVVVRRTGRRQLVSATWADERPDLVADIVGLGDGPS